MTKLYSQLEPRHFVFLGSWSRGWTHWPALQQMYHAGRPGERWLGGLEGGCRGGWGVAAAWTFLFVRVSLASPWSPMKPCTERRLEQRSWKIAMRRVTGMPVFQKFRYVKIWWQQAASETNHSVAQLLNHSEFWIIHSKNFEGNGLLRSPANFRMIPMLEVKSKPRGWCRSCWRLVIVVLDVLTWWLLVTWWRLVTPGDPCKFILPWSSSPQIASLLCAEASCFEVFEPSDDFEPDLSVANVKASRKQALTQREKKRTRC